MVGEPVQQGSGEAFRAEDLGLLVERQVGGDQDGSPFVALAEDLEEQFSAGCSASTTFAGSVNYSCRFTPCFRLRCWATPVR